MKKFVLAVAGALLILMAVPTIELAIPAQKSDRETPKDKTKTFTGTIVKRGDNFVLNDAVNKTAYMLDDAEQASQFEGKKVKVTGTVDVASNTLHVETIKEIPSGNARLQSYPRTREARQA
jgi:Protein of unknown function (DUF5818)